PTPPPLAGSRTPRRLPAFPTRRSSDLAVADHRHGLRELVQLGVVLALAVTLRQVALLRCGDLGAGRRREREQVRVLLAGVELDEDRKSTRLNSSHVKISYAVFCLKKKK